VPAVEGEATGLTSAEVERLYRRYGFFLRRRCALITKDGQLADDALHEAFVRVQLKGAVVRDMERPLHWLTRVVDRCALDQLRRGKRLRSAEPISAAEGEAGAGAHPAISAEMRDAVLEILRELDDEEQRICLMAFVDGMTQGEIADEIGYSRVTVNKKIQGIRARAEKALGGRAG
jgi:RNA polymerase sigma-70 factor (ECF subfamily)